MGCYIMKNYYDECIGCGAKVQGKDELFGECTECAMVMKQKKCKKVSDCSSVRGWRWYTLTMFNKVNMEIVEGISGSDLETAM